MENKIVQNMATNRPKCIQQIREWFDEESLIGLAQSIKETGILQPILVRREGSEFIVVEGERRLRAAAMVGITEVPVLIDDRELSEGEILYRQIVTNSQRENLTPIEKSRAFDRLMKATGWNAATVAVKLGISPGTISKHLALLNLPEDVQEKVAAGRIGLAAAYDISRGENPEGQSAHGTDNRGSSSEPKAQRKKSRRARSSGRKCSSDDGEQIVIPLTGGRTITAMGPGMTLDAFITELENILARIKELQAQGLGIADAVKFITERNHEAA
jgi:ParB family chromosome partitioning protein